MAAASLSADELIAFNAHVSGLMSDPDNVFVVDLRGGMDGKPDEIAEGGDAIRGKHGVNTIL